MTAIPKPKRIRDEAYGDFIRSQPCLIRHKHLCVGVVEAHHVIPEGEGRTGSKVSDYRQVPLCRGAHILAARREWFQSHFGVNFEYSIFQLYSRYLIANSGKVKRERKPILGLHSMSIHCDCWRRKHTIPRSKLQLLKHGVIEFLCVTENRQKRVRI